MKKNAKASDILLGGLEGHYAKIHRLIKWLCIVFVALTLVFLVWINVQYAKIGGEDIVNYLIGSFLFFFFLVFIFSISFYFFKNTKNKHTKAFLYFADNPDTLISYQIIEGGITKLILVNNSNNKVTFSIELPPLEVEELIFEIFPNSRKNKEHKESDTFVINEFQPQSQKIDKSILMQNIPSALKMYFNEKLSTKLGCLPYIFGIFLTGIIMSLIGRFGWYNVWIFDVGNSYWGYFILPLLAFGFMLFTAKSEDKKIHNLLKKPENVIWIYLKNTKEESILPSSTKTTLVIADVKEKYEVSLFENKEETLLWLSQYCPLAVVGFYYEWDEIYKENPAEFTKLISKS